MNAIDWVECISRGSSSVRSSSDDASTPSPVHVGSLKIQDPLGMTVGG